MNKNMLNGDKVFSVSEIDFFKSCNFGRIKLYVDMLVWVSSDSKIFQLSSQNF
jgi:hypothetical protein